MKRFWSRRTVLERCEFVAAILVTLILLGAHIVFFLRAGPLWRDEISSLTLATKSTFTDFWKSLPFDPFPASYFLLLRFWQTIGLGESSLALRGLGLLVGLSVIAALWPTCYLINKSAPLWPLTLFALNPLTLEGGDSIRPYGFGLIWIVLAFGLIWRIAFGDFEKRTVLFALIAALLSVQSLFTNAFILFAIGMGAVVVSLQNKSWRAVALIMGVGLAAALSLLLYLPIVRATQDWAKIIANQNDIGSVIAVGRDAIADPGTLAKWTWLTLDSTLFAALVVAVVFRSRLAPIVDLSRDCVIFAGTTLSIAAAATVGFLCAAHYLVFPRYFLPAIAVAALCVHVFWSALPNRIAVRVASLCLALVVATASLPRFYRRAKMRMTNCDQIAATLEQRVTGADLIIVTSFLYGVSFQRYYHGRASWLAVPQVADFSLHRWDLLKQAMAQPDPMPDLISRAELVLKTGHKIFLVGKLGPPPAEEPESLPPAPQSEFGWQMEPYLAQWKSELTYWLEHHPLQGNDLPIEEGQFVNPLERLGLFEVSGWRE
jgi:membrane protein implicated in regulation of membrane protease activity